MMTSHTKRVQFSCQVELVSTFANEEYDRTAQEVAKLTYHDMFELLTLKSEIRRQMEELRNEQAANSDSDEESNTTAEEKDQPSSSSSSLSSSSLPLPPSSDEDGQQQQQQPQHTIPPCDICA
ncbi:hypothetical protein BDB00DRAFT_857223 [Zychaea mexicana]|uniref:uncharacterized protein n=1 Tax=Zychaea mexicana TaxID=64656 RepID=UPI0022FEC480|nr:uncharacterized protein BDB00DRAFT_857223 [Zychaea mexicana]KAI9482587.1 hypothetical protein BDB00DRAFT_857223 [Zychaea mexicana]